MINTKFLEQIKTEFEKLADIRFGKSPNDTKPEGVSYSLGHQDTMKALEKVIEANRKDDKCQDSL